MEMKYPRFCEFCRKQKTELCEKCGLVHVDPIPVPIPRHFWYAVDDDLTVDVDDITMPVDYSRLVSNDVVNHPSHYQSDSGLEVIDVIEAFTADLQGIEAVCTANALKYVCRWKKKNGLEDLKKAQWYLNRLITTIEKENN